MRRMKCLVTGCAGFIGSHLAESLLADGAEVVGVEENGAVAQGFNTRAMAWASIVNGRPETFDY